MMIRVLIIVVLITVLCSRSVYGQSIVNETEGGQCGNIFTEKESTLISDNYPSPYPNDKECFYLLKGENCTVQFNIEFLDFDIKTSVGCTKDRLEIGHQDALCGKINGSKVYNAVKGSLKLKFISNNESEKNNRGFRMLVTRIDSCDPSNSSVGGNITFENRDEFDITTKSTQVEWTSKKIPLQPTYLPPVAKQCCQNNIFASKRFFMVSPNFPYSRNTPEDCIYVIKQASPEVCRLRINVLFFSLGPSTQSSCPYGHLEIDRKYICGCNSDLKLTTNFRGSTSKIIRYHNTGYNTNDMFGFVLEVIQDECPKRYSPDDGVLAERSSGNFRFYNDQYNRISWPEHKNIDQLKLVNERVYWPSRENNWKERQYDNIYKHFYFFAPQDEEDISWVQDRQDREETNYIEISTIDMLLTNIYNYQQCVQWNTKQLVTLKRRYGNSLNLMCQSFQQNTHDVTNCRVLSSIDGNIQSPGYPVVYPTNQNICYRFQILPGYCAVKIYFNDFQTERSYDCLKDYLGINQYRYCGDYLVNKQVTINLKGKSHQDLNFITDANYCGKGFSAMYQQVPCQKTNDPITPINCNNEGKTTDCNRITREKNFILRSEPGKNFCLFKIRKSSKDVCKINIYLERFDVPCDLASIQIDGHTYCGQMSGQNFTIDIFDEKTIYYRKNSQHFHMNYNENFLFRGTQISDDCGNTTPEPARLVLRGSRSGNIFANYKLENTIYPDYYPDVCNLIKNNITSEELANKICKVLSKYQNISDCKFFKADILDMADNERNVTKVLLTNGGVKELNYNIIDCQN